MPNRRTRPLLWLAAALVPAMSTGVAAQVGGTVSGVVWDSIFDEPLSDAAVFLWDTSHRAVTDDEGRFEISGIPSGQYTILFFHTRLGELGASPGPVPITVDASRERLTVELATPSMATVVGAQCFMDDAPAGSGAVAGRTLDAESGVALGGAVVTLSWQEGDDPVPRSLVARSGSDGWFRSCGVPAEVPVLLAADYYGRRGARREVTLDPDGFFDATTLLADLPTTHVSGQLVDATTERPVDGAEAWLRGTGHRTLSDGSGRFAFEGVPAGTYMMMTDHLAYGTKMDTLVVPGGTRLLVEMRLDTRPIPMAPLSVTVEGPGIDLDVVRARGGLLITSEEMDEVRQTSRDASDVLRSLHVPGVIVRHQSNGDICVGVSAGQVKLQQTGCVPMVIFVNDVRATSPEMALRLPPDSIERMVIFKPVEAASLFGLGGASGVWMIYTRGN